MLTKRSLGRPPARLAREPGRIALLEERAQPLLPLRARSARCRDLRGLEPCRTLANEPLRLTHRLGAAGEERIDDGGYGRLRIVRDLVHEPDPTRRIGAETLAGREVATGGRADASEDEGRDDRGNDSEPYLREAEDRIRRRDRDVGARDEPAPAAERMSVHAADDGRRAGIERLEHPVEPHRVLDVPLVSEVDRGALPLDVGAGAEAGAVAGEHHRPRVADVGERLGQRGDELGVEGVPPLRTGERDVQDVTFPLDAQSAHVAELRVGGMLKGALAASVTPLRGNGDEIDEDAFAPLVDFYVDAGLDGILALGTAGEGILLSVEERRRVADVFLQAAHHRLDVAIQCGAQTTADTVALAAHAAEVGADAVVAIGPPYFKLDERAQFSHFLATAQACAPLPFYIYEFESTAGYAVEPAVLERLREESENVQGLKVSDTPYERFQRYLLPGFDVFVGPEALIHQGLTGGAVGAVSALASAFPSEVAAVVRESTEDGAVLLGELRAFVERFPRQAALKHLLGLRGIPVREDVRAPLRALTADERDELTAWSSYRETVSNSS